METKDDINIVKTKLFTDTILHGVSKEPKTYLELSQTSVREYFCKNSQGLSVFRLHLKKKKILSVHVKDKSCSSPEGL